MHVNLLGLVLLYIEKVQKYLDAQSSGLSNPKEEVFRCILTLHSLLENPPGDFPNDLREDIVDGFIRIFAHVRYIYGPLFTYSFFLHLMAEAWGKLQIWALLANLHSAVAGMKVKFRAS